MHVRRRALTQQVSQMLGLRDMLNPIGVDARCSCHCRVTKSKLAYRKEVCPHCPVAKDKAGNEIPFACHVIIGGATCTIGGVEFEVHMSSKDRMLNVRLYGDATKDVRYLSIALLSTEGSRSDPQYASSYHHGLELFRIPHDPTIAPHDPPPDGCVASLDDGLLIGSVLSHFLITSMLPGEQLPARRL